MKPEMTAISRGLYNAAKSDILTIQDAVEYLEREARIRTLYEKLEKFSHGKDLRKTLVRGLLENDPKRKKDAVERRVRGWLSIDNPVRTIKRQDAIEVCFILGLSIEEADGLVAMVSEESLHYRNPDEIVYIFALQHGMSYREAQELNAQMKETLSKVRERKPSEDSLTPLIREEVSCLQTKKELADYLEHAVDRLGRCHNNAYGIFMERIKILENPSQDEKLTAAEVIGKEHLTVRSVLREYMYEGNVLYAKELAGKKRGENKKSDNKKSIPFSGEEKFVFTTVKENVAANWPDEATLSKMKTRKTDVTRKVLILLFLATDQGSDESEEMQDGKDMGEETDGTLYQDRETVFEDLYSRLNDMLLLCGFSPLDPRSPFDWLILYSICVEDMWGVDARMRGIFRAMFGERPEEKGGTEINFKF